MRRTLALAAVTLAVAAPVAAVAATGDDPASFPASQLLPMRVTATPFLQTGGSTISLKVVPQATGNQGFSNNILITACVGAAACKTGTLSPRRANQGLTLTNFPLTDIRLPPFRVGIQVSACTLGFRCATFTGVRLAR